MSLILDALRKAERERELGQTPTIGSQLPLRRRASQTRRGPWIAIVAAVALTAIAIAAWSQRAAWWPSAEPGADVAAAVVPAGPADTAAQAPSSPVPASAMAVDGIAAAPEPAPVPTVGDMPPEKLAAIEAPPAMDMPDPIDEARRVAAEALAVAEAAKREAEKASAAVSAPAPVVPAPIAMGEPAPPSVPASAVAEPATSLQPDPAGVAPLPAVVETQKPAPEPVPDEPSLPPVQMAWELPLAMRQSMPKLTIAMHVWNAEPTRRFVVVNDERLVEGESAAAGVSIAEIRREGVVFEYQGQRFLLPRGGL